ncbi:phage tail sheath family protein [Umezawaea beigongshangensis]|uniref:phage tail sheath family protein n=1 Tax=Umezawaea beigongshangensis TaxID=2780383 RepID=UPI001E60777A|nr:phage tail sheath C-terminal domain-containing protein [Umezawaea beigongshangensis]
MPVTPSYPGVYVEELPSSVRTITTVSTSVTAFVGHTAKGPVDQAVTITSFADFERRFGGLSAGSPLGHSVQQFFLNGGTIAVVVRVVAGAVAASVQLKNSSSDQQNPPAAVLAVSAREPGAWGNGLRVAVDHATPTPDRTFALEVFATGGQPRERFTDLSMDPADPRYVVDVVNSGSSLVSVVHVDPSKKNRPEPTGTLSSAFDADLPEVEGVLKVGFAGDDAEHEIDVPATKAGSLAQLALLVENAVRAVPDPPGSRAFSSTRVRVAGKRLQVVSGAEDPGRVLVLGGPVGTALGFGASSNVTAYALGATEDSGSQGAGQAGADGTAPGPVDLIGNEVRKTGLNALRAVEDVNLLVLPEVCAFPDDENLDKAVAVLAAATRLCQDKRMFLIVDSPASWTTIDDARGELAKLESIRSSHSALYFPHQELFDPVSGRLRAFPPSGAVAGIMARTDSERGVWKAPAGTESRLSGTRALTVPMTDPENGLLNPLGVNCLRSFPVIGPVVWGARTLEGADALASQWKYVPVRRLALMIEESLYRGTKWVVFEPNDEPLWAQIRLNVGAFMHSLFERGAFQGVSSRDAYFVKCDKDTTTQNDVNSGVVNVLVGFAPLKPAEFVIIKIEQLAGQIEV